MIEIKDKVTFFPYYGGKGRLLELLYMSIPEGIDTVVDGCGGSGVFTINLAGIGNYKRVYNEYNSHICSIFKNLQTEYFEKRVFESTCTKNEFDTYFRNYVNEFKGISDEEKAVQMYILCRQSFNGTLTSISKQTTRSKYIHLVENSLGIVKEKMKGVTVTSMDIFDILENYKNNENTLIFADVPYLLKCRNGKAYGIKGKFEWSQSMHIKFLKLARECKCKIIICGYNDDYDFIYDRTLVGWESHVIGVIAKLCQNKGRGQEKDKAIEYIWHNFKLPQETAEYIKENVMPKFEEEKARRERLSKIEALFT